MRTNCPPSGRLTIVFFGDIHVCQRHANSAATGHRLICVQNDILDHLSQLTLVCFNRPQISRNVHLVIGTGAAQGELHGVLDRGPDPDQFLYRLAALGEGQQAGLSG